jgi:hypothetical protein
VACGEGEAAGKQICTRPGGILFILLAFFEVYSYQAESEPTHSFRHESAIKFLACNTSYVSRPLVMKQVYVCMGRNINFSEKYYLRLFGLNEEI